MDYQAIRSEISRLKTELHSLAQDIFTSESAGLFEKFPELDSFSWNQYTPYFNDGDECVFDANVDSDSITVNAERGYDVPIESKYTYNGDNTAYYAEQKEKKYLHTAVGEFLSQFDTDDLKTMFGDHAEVTIDRGGKVTVEAYDHD